jgi:hypothetical protein
MLIQRKLHSTMAQATGSLHSQQPFMHTHRFTFSQTAKDS